MEVTITIISRRKREDYISHPQGSRRT